jgi:hypothetical protein
MRRHRKTASKVSNNSNGNMHNFMITTTSSSNSGGSTIDNSTSTHSAKRNKGNTNNRFLFLDLNLTPLENDLKFLKIGQSTPNLVDCFN